MTKTINLTKGQVATVDDDTYDWLSQYNWQARKDKYTYYARRCARDSDGRRYTVYMHREIMAASNGEMIDHVDGNGLNNTVANLRKCTSRQNSYNRKRRKDAKGQFKGLMWNSKRNQWRAIIRINGKVKSLGTFKTEKEAADAYDNAARSIFGEFARTNN